MDIDADSDDLSPSTGDLVVDREDANPDPAVVINKPPVQCDEWTVPVGPEDEDITVADENPEYDPESEVIIVAYHGDLSESHPDWSKREGSLRLAEAECATYAFPPGRLKVLSADEIDGVESDRWK